MSVQANVGAHPLPEACLLQKKKFIKHSKDLAPPLASGSSPSHEELLYRQLEQALGGSVVEGNSNQVMEETKVMNRLVSDKRIKTVCETGFNAGHGTLRWLIHSSPDVHVYSFDIGVHDYAKKGAAWIAQTFPGRHTITWGDSTKTLPAFHQKHPEVKCDLILVDGGHMYDVALADLKNFMRMANPDFNTVMMDDVRCPATFCSAPQKAWQDMINGKIIQETEAHTSGHRGFACGVYTNVSRASATVSNT